MSDLPSVVRVKRKRLDEPTPDLFLEEPLRKKQSVVWQFRLLPTVENGSDRVQFEQSKQQQPQPQHNQQQQQQRQTTEQYQQPERRVFRLLPQSAAGSNAVTSASALEPQTGHPAPPTSHRTDLSVADAATAAARIPTFVEHKPREPRDDSSSTVRVASTVGTTPAARVEQPLKRPGPSSRRLPSVPSPAASGPSADKTRPPREQSDRLTAALHRFAVEEAARETERVKPAVTVVPRPRPRHSGQADPLTPGDAQTDADGVVDADTEMLDDGEYVYDTYVRTKEPVVAATTDPDADGEQARARAYIVITEADELEWEKYLTHHDSDSEEADDDDDENAENYYAADYPEDEVASDDEFDRNVYGYREHASDDEEQWGDAGDADPTFSDDESDAQLNPWKRYAWMQQNR